MNNKFKEGIWAILAGATLALVTLYLPMKDAYTLRLQVIASGAKEKTTAEQVEYLDSIKEAANPDSIQAQLTALAIESDRSRTETRSTDNRRKLVHELGVIILVCAAFIILAGFFKIVD